MTPRVNDTGLSAEFWYLLLTLVTAMIGGAVWLGSINSQANINNDRLMRIEQFTNEVRAHNADTLAREATVEKRLDILTNRIEQHIYNTQHPK